MGVSEQAGMGAIRFSLGRGTSSEDIENVIAQLRRVLA
jgi:cysteine desulfurase